MFDIGTDSLDKGFALKTVEDKAVDVRVTKMARRQVAVVPINDSSTLSDQEWLPRTPKLDQGGEVGHVYVAQADPLTGLQLIDGRAPSASSRFLTTCPECALDEPHLIAAALSHTHR